MNILFLSSNRGQICGLNLAKPLHLLLMTGILGIVISGAVFLGYSFNPSQDNQALIGQWQTDVHRHQVQLANIREVADANVDALRTHPISGRREMHKGIDFAGTMGGPVIAVAKGVVTYSGKRYSYGNLIEIAHGNGYSTRYAHNSILLVSVGDTVEKGFQIAEIGSSGRSTGPHVHFEVLKNGREVNPIPFIRASN